MSRKYKVHFWDDGAPNLIIDELEYMPTAMYLRVKLDDRAILYPWHRIREIVEINAGDQ